MRARSDGGQYIIGVALGQEQKHFSNLKVLHGRLFRSRSK